MSDRPPVHVVGVVGGETFGAAARAALAGADVLVASPRHLASIEPGDHQEVVHLAGPLPPLLDHVADAQAACRAVCVVASGDPGFFGIVRALAARLGSANLTVHPAPSSVALAFAAAGTTWDDALVVSVHGRALDAGIRAALSARKVAVLTSPEHPPALVGERLLAAGAEADVVVASRLGEPEERVTRTDVAGLAGGDFDPLSVVLLLGATTPGPSATWGRDESVFAHRAGMITKSEVRAVVLTKLDLPRRGVLWDVGAGSGSVGIEAALLAPGLRVVAIERNPDDAGNIPVNAARHGAEIEVVVGAAPSAFEGVPAPDRAFVGGGGPDVVQATWDRLAPGGVLVATSVVLEHAVDLRRLLGEMVQLRIDVAVPIGSSGVRFEPRNPVFVCWGRR